METLKKHFYIDFNGKSQEYTFAAALDLAKSIINWKIGTGPFPRSNAFSTPTPTIDEAIEAIKGCGTMKSCNWLTGQLAMEVLTDAKENGVQP